MKTLANSDDPDSDAPPSSAVRLHDLDALRAIAMLLGIVLHAALSFVPGVPWPAKDVRAGEGYGVMVHLIHGFRMALFFMLSGFFTAMLWRRRGLWALAKHRAARVVLPLVLGGVTIVPLTGAAMRWAGDHASNVAERAADPGDDNASVGGLDLWTAAQVGDVASVRRHVDAGTDLDRRQTGTGSTPLAIASTYNHPRVVAELLRSGADANRPSRDGNTPLHSAAFFGRAEIAAQLMDAGADPEIQNNDGVTAEETLYADWTTTSAIASLIRLRIDRQDVSRGRQSAAQTMGAPPPGDLAEPGAIEQFISAVVWVLFGPVLHHLWFLWYLALLVAAFLAYGASAGAIRITPEWFGGRALRFWRFVVLSPFHYVYLVPLVMLPQALMQSGFGPDTSSGLFPIPRILLYYALFFFFGAVYYDVFMVADRSMGRLARRGWPVTLAIGLGIVFPLGLDCATGQFGWTAGRCSETTRRWLAVLFQSLYVWMMIFGSMGLFRTVFSGRNATLRYLSDSSYWLYLAHLPLIVVLQAVVAPWRGPSALKFGGICLVSTALLLLTYQYGVRYTPVGRLLNGPRKRPA